MATVKECLSQQAIRLADARGSVRLYTTAQVGKRLSVRSMTLMRWIVYEDIGCPALHISNDTSLHWLWNEEEIRGAAEFKKRAFAKLTHRRSRR